MPFSNPNGSDQWFKSTLADARLLDPISAAAEPIAHSSEIQVNTEHVHVRVSRPDWHSTPALGSHIGCLSYASPTLVRDHTQRHVGCCTATLILRSAHSYGVPNCSSVRPASSFHLGCHTDSDYGMPHCCSAIFICNILCALNIWASLFYN